MPDFTALDPRDEHNLELEAKTHPPDWVNPTPDGRYNLVVIGGGTAGLVSAIGGSGLGAKVALIERELMGGDCLNLGCVPSKAVIRSARAAAAVRDAGAFGVEVPAGVRIDFAAAMERMRRLRARIADHDSAQRLRDHGVDVFLGEGRFSGPDTVAVGGQALRFKKAVIATGARAAAPPIPGLDQVEYLTNETLFSLTELPARLGVIGAGPVGCELGQSFALLGSDVILVEAEHGILPREDRDAAAIVERSMVGDGVKLLCCGLETRIRNENGQIRLVLESHGEGYDEPVDRLLVAAGRAPNVEGLNLEAVGVEYDRSGVQVDDHLRTTNPHIYAAGDVASRYKFTHAANSLARVVLRNALFRGSSKASALTIPWCTYTLPELAHVGLLGDHVGDDARHRPRQDQGLDPPLSDAGPSDATDRRSIQPRAAHSVGCVAVPQVARLDTLIGARREGVLKSRASALRAAHLKRPDASEFVPFNPGNPRRGPQALSLRGAAGESDSRTGPRRLVLARRQTGGIVTPRVNPRKDAHRTGGEQRLCRGFRGTCS